MLCNSGRKGYMDFGYAIRTLREERGWVQEELAFRCNTTSATISRIEQGRAQPSFSMLHALAHGFGLTLSELIAVSEGAKRPPPSPTEDPLDNEATQLFKSLSPIQKAACLSFIRAMLRP